MKFQAAIKLTTVEFEAENEFIANMALAEMYRVLLENNPHLGVETLDLKIRQIMDSDDE
jgi:hypothetical protein